jgi:hypothetical protein
MIMIYPRTPILFKNKKRDITYSVSAVNIDGTIADGFQVKDNVPSSIVGKQWDELDAEIDLEIKSSESSSDSTRQKRLHLVL